MKQTASRYKIWYDAEVLREKVLTFVANNPQAKAFEVAEDLGMTQPQAYHHLHKLVISGHVERIGSKIVAVYSATGKPFDRRYPDGYVEEMEAQKVKNLQERSARNRQYHREAKSRKDTDDSASVVVKVNEHTTVYYNSRKKATPQTKTGIRKTHSRGVGSGMAMFESW